MIDHHRNVKRTLLSALFFLLLSVGNKLTAQDGRAIFQNNCASCHSVTKNLTGPALAGVTSRGPWSDRKKIYAWVHNPAAFMANDPYTQGLKSQFGGAMMTPFPDLTEKEIDAVIEYIGKTATAAAAKPAGGDKGDESTKMGTSDSSILYGVLTLILAVVALIMLQVNSNLKKLADDKEGHPSYEPIPFYRNNFIVHGFSSLVIFFSFFIGVWISSSSV